MGRKNSATHGRRAKARPPEPRKPAPSFDAIALKLVTRGLAPKSILSSGSSRKASDD